MDELFDQYPLSGLKVLELATVIAAPSAARLLCAYGAEVIKIENLIGDDARYVGSFHDTPYGDFQNPSFTVQNSSKRLISLNLKSAEGVRIFWELLENADVFVTNMRQDALERLGIDYPTVKEMLPRLIYAHLTGFGPEGPAAKDPGYDATTFWSRTGCFADWPAEGDAPFSPSYGFGDNATGMALLSGILMALYGREKNGHGSYVTTSLFASGIWYNSNGLVINQFYRMPQNRNINHPAAMFTNVYRCKDGRWVSVFETNYVRAFPKFAKAMGMYDMLEDPRYQTYEEMHRSGAIFESVKRCQELFLEKTAEEWKEYLAENDIACEIAQHIVDLCHDEQALANGYVRTVDFADGLKVGMAEPPISFGEYGRREYEPCGAIGQETAEVLQELGYTEDEILMLREKKAVR